MKVTTRWNGDRTCRIIKVDLVALRHYPIEVQLDFVGLLCGHLTTRFGVGHVLDEQIELEYQKYVNRPSPVRDREFMLLRNMVLDGLRNSSALSPSDDFLPVLVKLHQANAM